MTTTTTATRDPYAGGNPTPPRAYVDERPYEDAHEGHRPHGRGTWTFRNKATGGQVTSEGGYGVAVADLPPDFDFELLPCSRRTGGVVYDYDTR